MIDEFNLDSFDNKLGKSDEKDLKVDDALKNETSIFDSEVKKKESVKNENVSEKIQFDHNSLKLKKFVRHLASSAKQLEKINVARNELQNKLNEMKSLKKQKSSDFKNNIDGHVDELMAKLDFLVESEKKILKKSSVNTGSLIEDSSKIKLLEKEIENLRQENSKIDSLTKTVEQLTLKLDSQEQRKIDREKRMEELERKIQERVSANSTEFSEIEQNLKLLTSRYNELIQTGKHSEDDLSLIKEKIENLKQILETKK